MEYRKNSGFFHRDLHVFKKKLVDQHEERWDKKVDSRLPFKMTRLIQRCSCAVALL